jgi:hypothetical protein
MLLAALIMSAVLGHMQDQAYLDYGKAWQENLFYSHMLAIPGFLIVGSDIISHANKWLTMPGITPFNTISYCPDHTKAHCVCSVSRYIIGIRLGYSITNQ